MMSVKVGGSRARNCRQCDRPTEPREPPHGAAGKSSVRDSWSPDFFLVGSLRHERIVLDTLLL